MTFDSRPKKRVARRSGPPEPPKNVRHYVAWLLSRKDYSEKQLRAKLKQRGVPTEEADAAIAVMKEYGFQNDERYAGIRANGLASRMGNRRIAADLQAKGIAQETIAEKLEEVAPEEDRVLLAVRRFEGKPFDQALKTKVWRHLAQRGFSSSSIKFAMEELKKAASEGDADLSGLDDE